jgi:hypothetical protein
LSNHESPLGLVAELNRRAGMDQREVEGETGHVDGELAVGLPEDAELADRTCDESDALIFSVQLELGF